MKKFSLTGSHRGHRAHYEKLCYICGYVNETLIRFPADEVELKIWREILQIKKKDEHNHAAYLCRSHFDIKDFRSNGAKRNKTLKRGSYPKLCLPNRTDVGPDTPIVHNKCNWKVKTVGWKENNENRLLCNQSPVTSQDTGPLDVMKEEILEEKKHILPFEIKEEMPDIPNKEGLPSQIKEEIPNTVKEEVLSFAIKDENPDSNAVTSSPMEAGSRQNHICYICGPRSLSPKVNKFPQCPNMREKWEEALSIPPDKRGRSRRYLCTAHFREEDFKLYTITITANANQGTEQDSCPHSVEEVVKDVEEEKPDVEEIQIEEENLYFDVVIEEIVSVEIQEEIPDTNVIALSPEAGRSNVDDEDTEDAADSLYPGFPGGDFFEFLIEFSRPKHIDVEKLKRLLEEWMENLVVMKEKRFTSETGSSHSTSTATEHTQTCTIQSAIRHKVISHEGFPGFPGGNFLAFLIEFGRPKPEDSEKLERLILLLGQWIANLALLKGKGGVTSSKRLKQTTVTAHEVRSEEDVCVTNFSELPRDHQDYSCRGINHTPQIGFPDHFNRNQSYSCKICQKSFTSVEKLRAHKKYHPGVYDKRRSYLCPYCGKLYSGYYYTHEKIHLREAGLYTPPLRSYVCAFCGKCFAQKHNCEKHERIHTGEKPFSCRFCSKTFARDDNRVIHERSHTGVKPYTCKFCAKRFSTWSNCAVHEKLHMQEKKSTHKQKKNKKMYISNETYRN